MQREEQERGGVPRVRAVGVGRALLQEMHPTAAVCGKPRDVTYPVIGEVEGFDRYLDVDAHVHVHVDVDVAPFRGVSLLVGCGGGGG